MKCRLVEIIRPTGSQAVESIVVSLAGCKAQLRGQAIGVDDSVNLACQPANETQRTWTRLLLAAIFGS
jgi:hypothetical protein